jgi:16S rRNA processing protein RimM
VTDPVLVGRIVKPHGIRGEVVVESLSDVPGRFDDGTVLATDRGGPVTIVSSRPHQGRLLVVFEGVADRTAAEAMRGRRLYGETVDVSDSDTYFAHELAGMAVADADGRELGTVRDVIELPDAAGYDLLEVERADGGVWLLPAVDDYVEVAVDDDGVESLVVTDAPEGLLDDAYGVEQP